VNIDFADVRAIMGHGDVGMIAVGSGKGPGKVEDAVDGVLKNRLLDVDFAGARGAIIHIAGGADLTLGDAIKAGELVTDQMEANANVKWGARLIPDYDGKIEICAIVTGVKSAQIVGRTAPQKKPQKDAGYDIEIIS
jgi:cell division protein FtsZ